MSETTSWLPTVVASAVTVLGALFAFWATRGKTQAEADTAGTGQLIQGWEAHAKKLSEELARIEVRMTAMEEEAAEAKTQRDHANGLVRDLERRLGNALALLSEYVRWSAELVRHINAGSPPPPPAEPWQIRDYQNRLNSEGEAP